MFYPPDEAAPDVSLPPSLVGEAGMKVPPSPPTPQTLKDRPFEQAISWFEHPCPPPPTPVSGTTTDIKALIKPIL